VAAGVVDTDAVDVQVGVRPVATLAANVSASPWLSNRFVWWVTWLPPRLIVLSRTAHFVMLLIGELRSCSAMALRRSALRGRRRRVCRWAALERRSSCTAVTRPLGLRLVSTGESPLAGWFEVTGVRPCRIQGRTRRVTPGVEGVMARTRAMVRAACAVWNASRPKMTTSVPPLR